MPSRGVEGQTRRAYRLGMEALADLDPELAGDVDDYVHILRERGWRLTERARRAEGTWRTDVGVSQARAEYRQRQIDIVIETAGLGFDEDLAAAIVTALMPETQELDPAPWMKQAPSGDGTEPEVRTESREPLCVANWPDCFNGGYDPRCCRFPKSCSVQTIDTKETNRG